MSAKGEHGMIIHLDRVPTRQADMKPWEMLLSESQERMLIVVKKGEEEAILRIFDKWDIHCVQIGEVTKEPRLKYYMHGTLVADVPAESLVLGGGAPVYQREYTEPKYLAEVAKFDESNIPVPGDLKAVAYDLIQLPNIASKRWIWEQYDSMVGTGNTNTNAPSDAAVVRIHGANKGLAMSVDCNGRYVEANPFQGAAMAVAEAARNISCSGGLPVGVTNCLNFGNPYNPEVYWQFVHAIKGMGAACEAFETPVTGGNVSFYNQSEDGPVFPTPTIGMVGILDDMADKMTLGFKNAGDTIYLLGRHADEMGSSEYLHHLCGVRYSPAPRFNLDEEVLLQKTVRRLISEKLIQSAHDCSEGGLFACMLESAPAGNLGFDLDLPKNFRKDALLFGESAGRVVVSVKTALVPVFEAEVGNQPFVKLGCVKATRELCVDHESWGYLPDWKKAYDEALEKLLAG